MFMILHGVTVGHYLDLQGIDLFVIFANDLNAKCMGLHRTFNDNHKSDRCMQFTEEVIDIPL